MAGVYLGSYLKHDRTPLFLFPRNPGSWLGHESVPCWLDRHVIWLAAGVKAENLQKMQLKVGTYKLISIDLIATSRPYSSSVKSQTAQTKTSIPHQFQFQEAIYSVIFALKTKELNELRET